jgi:hypothetical protein
VASRLHRSCWGMPTSAQSPDVMFWTKGAV